MFFFFWPLQLHTVAEVPKPQLQQDAPFKFLDFRADSSHSRGSQERADLPEGQNRSIFLFGIVTIQRESRFSRSLACLGFDP